MKRSSQILATLVLTALAGPAPGLAATDWIPTAPVALPGMSEPAAIPAPSARSDSAAGTDVPWASVLPRVRREVKLAESSTGAVTAPSAPSATHAQRAATRQLGERVPDPGNSEDALQQHADFKGPSSPAQLTFGAMGGVSLIGSRAGFALIGNIAKKIVNRGFVPDINDQVYAEIEAGPALYSGPDAFVYSAHLRWDFQKDNSIIPYAFAGLAGYEVSGPGDLPIFPRFGAGVFMNVAPGLTVRAELSHELMLAGVSFAM